MAMEDRVVMTNVSSGKISWTYDWKGYLEDVPADPLITEIHPGTVIAVDKYLIQLDHRGEIRIGLRKPSGFKEISTCRILDGECITPPAFSNGRLFCRNRMGRLVCIDFRDD